MGYLRLALAFLVLAGHSGSLPQILADWSVWVFYILAGYTGTASIKNYQNPVHWWLSRYLRLWSSWIIVFVGAFFFAPINSMPPVPLTLHALMLWPSIPPHLTLNPPGWVLPIMLFWWGAMALGIAKDQRSSLIWLAASIGPALFIDGLPHEIAKGSLFFAVGSLAWNAGLKIPRDKGRSIMAGELSYPIYLLHFPLMWILVGKSVPYGWPLFFAVTSPTLVLAWLLVLLVERPIDRIRKSIH